MGSQEGTQDNASPPSPHPATSINLHEAITTRHSSREFLPDPVPTAALHRALTLATQSPSNTNVQPWRLWVLSGAPLAHLKRELVARAAADDMPQIPPLPAWANTYRSELGKLIYAGGWDIPWADKEARKRALLRNFEFFGAPMGAVVCMKNDLDSADSLSVGMYLQTLVLALRAEGVATCVEISIAGYPDVVKKTAGIPDDMIVICGMAIGIENPEAKINTMRPPRLRFEDTTVFLSD